MAGSRSSVAVVARVATIPLLLLTAPATDVPRSAAPSYIVTDLGTFGSIQSAEALEIKLVRPSARFATTIGRTR